MRAGLEIVHQSSRSFEDPQEGPHVTYPIVVTQVMVELGPKLCLSGGCP